MSGPAGIIGLAFTLVLCSLCMSDWKDGFGLRELFTNLGLQAVAIAALIGVSGILYGCNMAIGRQP